MENEINGMGLTDDFITFSVYDILQCGTQNEIPSVHTSKRCHFSGKPHRKRYTIIHMNGHTYAHT